MSEPAHSEDPQLGIAPADAGTSRPWRKRHPALSRTLLYGGAALVGALLVWLLVLDREDRDAERIRALRAELEALDILFTVEGLAGRAIEELDAKFGEEQVPPAVYHSATRMRAQAHSHMGETTRALEVIQQLDPKHATPLENAAAQLEHAEILARADRKVEALELLGASPPNGPAALGLLWAAERGWILETRGEKAAALEVLEGALRDCPPLSATSAPLRVGVKSWTAPDAAAVIAGQLAELLPPERRSEPWRRLLSVAPDDFDAAALAARGFLACGDQEMARRAWMQALTLDAPAAVRFARGSAEIRVLHAEVKNLLNPDAPSGR